MSEKNCITQFNGMPNCATELLFNIFSFLKPKHLVTCRQVCNRWKQVVDVLFRNKIQWKRFCEEDFPDIYKTAYAIRKSELSWYNLYRSLTLWSKLNSATEDLDEFALASKLMYEIRGFQILRNGEIGVHTGNGIVYYNVNTLKHSSRGTISGDYICYFENDFVILVLGTGSRIYIIRNGKILHQEDTLFPPAKHVLLIDNVIYYVTLDNEICMCCLDNEVITHRLLIQMSDSVLCLAHKNDHLYALTRQREIYKIVDRGRVLQTTLDKAHNLMHALNQYNFLGNLDWMAYFQWMFMLNHNIQGPVRYTNVVKVYGDIVFVGTNFGILRIYYSPYLNNELDLFYTQPVKEYNFSECKDCPVLTIPPIIQIDVIEGLDSHTVLVCMPKKIALLNYSHHIENNLLQNNFKDPSSVEILNINV